ncbi:MAG: sulfurtransferase [Leptospira sp.]|jgi:phage shock protein E|nr:MAG: sulfurtransferase [Leptospira sp.]
MGLTITIITLVVSTIFLVFRFSNRNVKLGGSSAAQQAYTKIQQGATIIDVRSSMEYAVSSFPGSINIPVADISDKLNSIPKDKPIVVYCASGGRSASARDILIRNGFSDVTNAGGLNDLEAASQK